MSLDLNAFKKIINDFTNDLLISFPEYKPIIAKWWTPTSINKEEDNDVLFVYNHCVKIFPIHFMSIMNKNEDIFSKESVLNTEFLPGIVFKYLWTFDISEQTRNIIWEYLQLILATVTKIMSENQPSSNIDELKDKMDILLSNIQSIFSQKEDKDAQKDENEDVSEHDNQQSHKAKEEKTETENENININDGDFDNINQMNENLQSMLTGKLGKMAGEFAEDFAKDLNLDMNNVGSASDVFKQLFNNKDGLTNLVSKMGTKIDEKIKGGQINESEIMEEGLNIIKNMNNIPGMDIHKIFSQMGLNIPAGLSKHTKVDTNKMEQKSKQAKMKERMKARMEAKTIQEQLAKLNEQKQQTQQTQGQQAYSEEELIKLFNKESKPVRSVRKDLCKK